MNFLNVSMPLLPLLGLLASHLVGDFFLQSNWMATNKSKSIAPLAAHVAIYSLCFLWVGPTFVVATFGLHFVTDYFTSRITSRLWFFQPTKVYYNAGGKRYECWIPEGGDRHWFFTTIGVDQYIHQICLVLTYLVLR